MPMNSAWRSDGIFDSGKLFFDPICTAGWKLHTAYQVPVERSIHFAEAISKITSEERHVTQAGFASMLDSTRVVGAFVIPVNNWGIELHTEPAIDVVSDK